MLPGIKTRVARPTDRLDDVVRFYRDGHEPVASFNPYWDRRGRTFEDPDGYRVVLENASWSS